MKVAEVQAQEWRAPAGPAAAATGASGLFAALLAENSAPPVEGGKSLPPLPGDADGFSFDLPPLPDAAIRPTGADTPATGPSGILLPSLPRAVLPAEKTVVAPIGGPSEEISLTRTDAAPPVAPDAAASLDRAAVQVLPPVALPQATLAPALPRTTVEGEDGTPADEADPLPEAADPTDLATVAPREVQVTPAPQAPIPAAAATAAPPQGVAAEVRQAADGMAVDGAGSARPGGAELRTAAHAADGAGSARPGGPELRAAAHAADGAVVAQTSGRQGRPVDGRPDARPVVASAGSSVGRAPLPEPAAAIVQDPAAESVVQVQEAAPPAAHAMGPRVATEPSRRSAGPVRAPEVVAAPAVPSNAAPPIHTDSLPAAQPKQVEPATTSVSRRPATAPDVENVPGSRPAQPGEATPTSATISFEAALEQVEAPAAPHRAEPEGLAPAADVAARVADLRPEGTEVQAADPLPGETLSLLDPDWPIEVQDLLVEAAETGASDIEIVLTPETLGRLRIRVEMRDGAAQVSFVTETADAARLLSGQEGRLADLLERQGLSLARHEAGQGDTGARQEIPDNSPRHRAFRPVPEPSEPAARAAGLVNLIA
ncbi:flagellar hook-length control protein FliK [Rhodobacter sp. NSM]|uniref:flagellar hook-length control protein FliK n=1 Tax=Rhodobacter sp. NSM TaxID=3457501 RepID=UPI003FD18EB1